MRHRLASQIRQSTDVCLFCAFRSSREASILQHNVLSPHRAFSSSSLRRRPGGASAAQRNYDDDEEELSPMLRENAAPARWPASDTAPRARTLPPIPRQDPPTHRHDQDRPHDRFQIRRVNPRFNQDNGQQAQRGRYQRRDVPYDSSHEVVANTIGEVAGTIQRLRRPGETIAFADVSDTITGRIVQLVLLREFARSAENGAYIKVSGHWRQSRTRPDTQEFVVQEMLKGDSNQQQTTSSVEARRDTAGPTDHRISGLYRNQKRLQLDQQDDGDQPTPTNITSTEETPQVSTMNTSRSSQPPQPPQPSEPMEPPEPSQFQPMFSNNDSQTRHDTQPVETNKSIRRLASVVDTEISMEKTDRPEHTSRSPTRLSARFQVDEDDELPVPAAVSRPRYSATASRNVSAQFDFDAFEAEQGMFGESRRRKKKRQPPTIQAQKPAVSIPEFMTVQQLAQAMRIKVDDLLQKLEDEGFEGARYDHMLDAETSAMFADIYGFDPIAAEETMQDLIPRPPPEDISILPPRPPIVTIMGHVDHGKTTILDWLRKSSVAAGEHGGITQHIGAFSVTMPGSERQITFLDTPGHEAFLDMRRRGANVTDIVVLVVAADDSVKPQTIEAIKHALQARVQLIVAINKVDKHDADIEKVKQDLVQHDIVVEDFGGDYQAIAVSGKTGQGMDQLEEAIITLADVLDLRAEQDGPAEGQIIEAKVTNAGRVATVLVRRGVLRVGDFIVAGPTWGRVRTLRNDTGQLVQEALPGDPVQVDGWRGIDPTAGLEVLQAENEQQAKAVVELRQERAESIQSASDVVAINAAKAAEAEARAKLLAWKAEDRANKVHHNEGFVDIIDTSGKKYVHFVVKADVAGSVEAIVAAVSAIGNNEIQANVIHSGTGPVTESDIRMLATTGEVGYAISFNQLVDPEVHQLADAAGLQILDQNIIYRVTDAVKEKVTEAMPPLITQRILGEAEVGQIFVVTVKKQKLKIAGCKVTKGTISRANQVRVFRNGDIVYTGTLESLKNVKKDVNEMRNGTECGVAFKDWEDVEEGDQVQCFEEVQEKRTLY
ncbi:translation initiation factor IF-2 [Lithohypha guttulata]|uniref:Translation initiation factor IF-2, mitochondrial n=1 Tax=Lithohypha guttulata TaxID=1690604 RepID=A0AAN7Y3V5_9EURO|nr:translation initiation factor IF-2 [Lithohypha guttulata]KAK5081303.1 translation initiation factor IF-2 [Lithohypha guttulata]